ncbi:MAG: flagellar motor protein MotB [Gammaproteobacteria bacterium]|nr:flagellar motor protein MotB [Gammaproteobacteria bacterium]MDH5731784.1 flagellar motor protein MotB [Gammaproteobacteria bacterium]
MAENAQPIIIKKVKKVVGGGHHGGSWKVAYADFVTAMMAFFLLLWLLNVSNEEVLDGIAKFFKNPSIVNASGGSSTSVIRLGKHVDVSRGQGELMRDSDNNDVNESTAQKIAEELERQQLEELQAEIEYEIDNTPELTPFKDQVLLDITEEGLRIQLVDDKNRPMFDLGSATLKPYARQLLKKIAKALNKVPNNISISGHTDARRYFAGTGYTNWELSADRANAARREMLASKFDPKKIARVVGMASKALYDTKNPLNPVNRRIAITVLNKATQEAIYRDEGAQGITMPVPEIIPQNQIENAIRNGTIRRGSVIRFGAEPEPEPSK